LQGAALALVLGLSAIGVTEATASGASSVPAGAVERIPAGFSEHRTRVAGIGLNYVIGGHGPTLLLIHGYPQT
jgi:hypothetical protein